MDNVQIRVAGVDDPSDMADSSGDIKRIEAWVDEGNLHLTMTVYGVFAPSVEDTPAGMSNRYYYHWLLDTDNNSDTGYLNDEYEGNPTNLQTPIGVDLLVQFGWRDGATAGVYAYTLDPLTGDEVELFEDYQYTIEGDTIHAVIPLEDLGLEPGQTIAVSAFQEGASNRWQCDWIESFELTLTAVAPAPKPKVIWVSYHGADDAPSADSAAAGFTEASDKAYTDLLKANGYDVERYITTGTPDADVLNAADLVIIGRAAASTHYQGDAATAWNTMITAPMIITRGYKLRSSRMGFTTGTDMPDTTGDIRLAISDPTHPIFAGIALTDGTMDNPLAGVVTYPDGTLARGISINNNTPDDEGIVLATISDASADTGPAGGMVIAEWPAGATLTHDGGAGTDVLAGPRLVFLTGAREADGITSHTAGLYDLYADGEKMFLNAVKYMIPVEPVDPGTDGLVAYYALENDAADSSGNGLDGTIVGEPVFVEGAMGMGLQLDGVDDYVDLGNDPLFDITEQITLSVWVNTQDIGTTENNPWLGKGDTSYMIKGHRVGNQIEFFIYDGGWYTAHADVGAEFNGEWHHAAGTFDGEQLKIYVDGKLSVTSEYVGGIGISTYNVAIGTNTQASGRFSESVFDEAAIYNRALSEGEILYLAGERAPIEPVHSYTFEDGTGNDSVGDADGVLVGDAAIVDGSLVVDGDGDWMEIPGDVIAINTYSEMTLELWSTQSVDNPFSMTASFGGTWDNGMGKDYIFIATGRGDQMNRGAIANTPDEVNPWEDEVGVSSPELNDGIEHQYVLTITAAELAYYVDGILIGTAPMGDTTISAVSNDFVFLGKGIYSVDPTMNCSINEFNIYDVALSAEQIAANFVEGPVE